MQKPINIKNPQEFKTHYLLDPPSSWCEAGQTNTGPAFMEVVPLEKLRPSMKTGTAATRRNFYTMVVITAGSARETIGHRTWSFDAGTIYFIPENVLHSTEHWSADIKGFHCIFDTDYFLLCLRNQVKLQLYPFFQPEKQPFLKLSPSSAKPVTELFSKLNMEHCRRKTLNDDLLVRLYLNVLLIELERLYLRQQQVKETALPKQQLLVAQFKKLISEYYTEKRQVSDYAGMLYVSPGYLNDTIREQTGKPASYYIQEQVILEAKAQLVQTEQTVSQISLNLSFSDTSYFCRFFRRHTGSSPEQYRQKVFLRD
ncbi:AraC family transcriptional regulator [Chitinophaga sp. XS-30]|uniref:helix-turn-helix domain-containing protein n=1 Tax=Chitinophaga sp. XS-30 TaxID=2604421 RepID=UPI0011DD232E|nr:AraC family transcriptional regulator [Chitinophaga sp. XS-30]QEH42222.1 helix-turn-helix domain-containing protein [Chitinophaga sp. XS-30]